MAAKKGPTPKTAVQNHDMTEKKFEDLAARIMALEDDVHQKNYQQDRQTRWEGGMMQAAIQRMPENANGSLAGKWCADFLKGFREGIKETAPEVTTPAADEHPAELEEHVAGPHPAE